MKADGVDYGWAVDSHAHVLDPHRYPFTNPTGYVPQANECGTGAEFTTVLSAHGMTHGLLVNPFAGYATDNRYMLDVIAGSNGRFKGVALVGHDTTDAQFSHWETALSTWLANNPSAVSSIPSGIATVPVSYDTGTSTPGQ